MVGLDPNDHLIRINHEATNQLVQPRQPVDAMGHTTRRQLCAIDVTHVGIMVVLGPIHPYEDHPLPPALLQSLPEPAERSSSGLTNGSVLAARHPRSSPRIPRQCFAISRPSH